MFGSSKFWRRVWIAIQMTSTISMTLITKKLLQSGYSPMVTTCEILLVGGTILLLMMWWRKERILWPEVRQVILPGIVGGGLANWLGYIGLGLTQMTNYTFLSKFTAVFSCILALIFLREKLTRNKLLAMIAIIFGSWLTSTQGKTLIPAVGDWLVIGSSLLYALSYILAARSMRQVSALAVSTYRTIIGGVVLLTISLISQQRVLVIESGIIWGGVAAAAAVLSAHKIMRIANVSYMALITSMVPVITAVVAVAFFGERMGVAQIIGAGSILAGSWLTKGKTN